ncbi:MAG: type II toxin-antitoxin system HipA family toxin, partial [Pseudomonadota bacterium]|nr:type II toxin-antitoxin system HipA family toxin [Pseudomonadota bacterium]
IALPLNGKKNNISRKDIVDYWGERMELTSKIIDAELTKISIAMPKWNALIDVSFLSEEMKKRYLNLLTERLDRLKIHPL